MNNVSALKENLMDTKLDDSSSASKKADVNHQNDRNHNGDLVEQDSVKDQARTVDTDGLNKSNKAAVGQINRKKDSTELCDDIEEISSDVDDFTDNKIDDEILEIKSNSSSDLYIVDENKDRPAIPKLRIKKDILFKVVPNEPTHSDSPKNNHSKQANKNNDVGCKNSNESEIPGTKVVAEETFSSELVRDKDTQEDVTAEKSAGAKEKRNSSKVASSGVEVANDDNETNVRENNSGEDGNSENTDVAIVNSFSEVVMEVDETDVAGEVSAVVVTKGNTIASKDVSSVQPMEVDEHLPAVNNSTQDADNIETITGDQSLSEEAVLKNPDINVCLLPVNSSDKTDTSSASHTDKTDENSKSSSDKDCRTSNDGSKGKEKETVSGGSTALLVPKPVSELTDNSKISPSSATAANTTNEDAAKKTIKVYIPPKKTPTTELVTVPVSPSLRDCLQCAKFTTCSTKITISGIDCYLCSKECIAEHKQLHRKAVAEGNVLLSSVAGSNTGLHTLVADNLPSSSNNTSNTPVLGAVSCKPTSSIVNPAASTSNVLTRRCTSCSKEIITGQENLLQWATMDFCSEDCLSNYQATTGSNCQLCNKAVSSVSLGKYSVRFGYDTRQFCTSQCLEEFKKGLKACSYCQRDLNSDGEGGESPGFLAPVGDKGQFKDFCSQDCLEKYDRMSNNLPEHVTANECAVCNKTKVVRVEVLTAEKTVQLCSDVCFNAFKFVNDKMKISFCFMCKKYFDISAYTEQIMYYDDQPMTFCTKTCMNVQVLSKRKICPCNWCKVKKYNFDMIRKKMPGNQIVYMCSLNCLALYQVSLKATIVKQNRLKCDWCLNVEKANFHLTMSDASLRNFCSFECVDKFRSQYKVGGSTKMVTTAAMIIAASGTTTNTTVNTLVAPPPNNTSNATVQNNITGNSLDLPVISSVHSLKKFETLTPRIVQKPSNQSEFPSVVSSAVVQQPTTVTAALQCPSTVSPSAGGPVSAAAQTQTVVEVLVRPKSPLVMKNKMTLVRVNRATKGTSYRPSRFSRGVQTEQGENDDLKSSCEDKALIPVPVPIYIPTPMAMYSVPVPTLIPVPIPVPIPVFIPTTKTLAEDILEDIKRIRETFPNNPIEAELVKMAEQVANKCKSKDADEAGPSSRLSGDEDMDVENNESRPSRFIEFEPLSVMEDSSSCGADNKTSSQQHSPENHAIDPLGSPAVNDSLDNEREGRTSDNGDRRPARMSTGIKCARKRLANTPQPGPASVKRKKAEELNRSINSKQVSVYKPDEHMKLKYTLGINAWKYFANNYNESLKKQCEDDDNGTAAAININKKLLKTDLLEMRHEELNEALTLLMSEGKLPNGENYSPDTKYYLALGIQYYLLNNGRIDNLFADPTYESFTDQLDNEASIFEETAASNGNNNIITRVIEEHLWEARQLGVHSPHVLLSTLMYLNTKYFNLTTLEEHLQLSFNHIIKRQSKRGTSATSSLLNNDEDLNHDDEYPNNTSVSSASHRNNNKLIVLRYYPSKETQGSNAKKLFYEQCENDEDPSRCPVRLYEFYLSRCPESVKSQDDIFYLQPERSCAPDSPVWYTSTPLSADLLKKMLNRMKMVKEINTAILAHQTNV
ncbi:hypothetical protein O3M35_002973 [Rhynocoris fuscipes]|uniref:TRASH domain-containing protein n=1 Tax=Rhynocoris fuscipes TaxID=488301 RepID=A0AAW1CIG8_9HEMI